MSPTQSAATRTPLPCNPASLGAVCVGGCGRRLHTGRNRGTKRACAEGHPGHAGKGRCPSCGRRDARRAVKPAPVGPEPGWQENAACRGVDPALFFPDVPSGVAGGAKKATEPIARRYCQPCPVREDCAAFADQTRSVGLYAGVWRRWQGSHYDRTAVIPAVEVESTPPRSGGAA